MGCIKLVLFVWAISILIDEIKCEELNYLQSQPFSNNLIASGRTLVHNSIKRLAIILPAIFFKLGIAFTLLLLVTIVAVNNGFIGFLLLVVGLSTVLARLQEARRPATYPLPISFLPPHHFGHHHLLDRSDVMTSTQQTKTVPSTSIYADSAFNRPSYSSDSSYVGALTNSAYSTRDNTGVVYGKYYATP